jgi:hypothetical protein
MLGGERGTGWRKGGAAMGCGRTGRLPRRRDAGIEDVLEREKSSQNAVLKSFLPGKHADDEFQEGWANHARRLMRDPEITVARIAEHLGVGISTLYRHLPGARGAAEASAPDSVSSWTEVRPSR